MNANTTPVITVTPEEFVAKILPLYIARLPLPDDYFVRNANTGKIEMILTKPAYAVLDTDAKKRVWSAFYWGKGAGCWISRANVEPELPLQVALSLGLRYMGETAADPFAKAEPKPEPVAKVTPATPAKAEPKAEKGVLVLDEAEIEHILHHGSGFEGGKIRIAALYASHPCPNDAKVFLKDEYGIGGCSHTFLNGASGFVDYDANGIKVREWKTSREFRLSWISVDTYLRAMVRKGVYLTPEEQAKYDEVTKPYAKRSAPPKPVARRQYPPEKH